MGSAEIRQYATMLLCYYALHCILCEAVCAAKCKCLKTHTILEIRQNANATLKRWKMQMLYINFCAMCIAQHYRFGKMQMQGTNIHLILLSMITDTTCHSCALKHKEIR